MAKVIAKYFIALVPTGTIQEEATRLKLLMQEKFKLKYALKSPSHVTIKMPFSYNEAKEVNLITKLSHFFSDFKPFSITLDGFDKFGKRVIFIHVQSSPELIEIQSQLRKYCKTKLNQVEELSDRSFHPHMTISFKDIKPARFDDYWSFIRSQKFSKAYQVDDIALLKRIEGRWEVVHRFPLGTG